MPPYKEAFPVGSLVRVRAREELEQFKGTWQFHNPITDEQLNHAGRVAAVRSVGFYHGGDPLYELDHIPGTWHEQCLEPITE